MKTHAIYDSVERLGELLKVGVRQAGSEYGLQPVHLEVLHYLSLCNKFSDTPMAVTEYLGLTKGTVSQTLKVLEKKALLEKYSDTNDKRITHLKLSVQGAQLVEAVLPTALFNNACQQLSLEKQTEIASSLKSLLTTLLQANNMKTFGLCKSCRHNQKTAEGHYFCGLVKQPLEDDDVELICREHEHSVASD